VLGVLGLRGGGEHADRSRDLAEGARRGRHQCGVVRPDSLVLQRRGERDDREVAGVLAAAGVGLGLARRRGVVVVVAAGGEGERGAHGTDAEQKVTAVQAARAQVAQVAAEFTRGLVHLDHRLAVRGVELAGHREELRVGALELPGGLATADHLTAPSAIGEAEPTR
jgi:hypothetical protein